MRYLFILIPLIFCFLSTNAQFKGLVVNEFSQGDAGNKEYFELVVAGTRTCTETTADLRGWIFDDQNGWYGGSGTGIATGHMRFANDPAWAAIPFGSIIVLYNKDDINTAITTAGLADDPFDANKDGVYVIPISKTATSVNGVIDINTTSPTSPSSATFVYGSAGSYAKLSTAGATAWNTILGLSNSGDAVITVNPAKPGQPFCSVVFGFVPTTGNTPTVTLGAVVAKKNAYLKDGNGDNYNIAGNWAIGDANTDETPGLPNTPLNKAWIDAMRQDPLPPTANTGNNTVCVGATTALSNATTGGTWSSATPGIATVNSTTGLVTGVAAGTVDIIYTIGGCKAVTSVVVTAGATTPVITGQAAMCTGSTALFTADNPGGTWSSSNTAILTVDPAGNVTAVAAGSANILYTTTGCGGATGTYAVTVTAAVTPGAVSGPDDVCKGTVITLTNTVAGGAWSSNNTAAATVNAATGEVTGVAAGTATITYTLSGTCQTGSSSKTITINDKPAKPVITGPTSVCKDADITLSADITTGSWTSADNAIASVDATTGLVHGVAGGNTIITYTVSNTCGNNATDYTVSVNDIPAVQAIQGGSSICVSTTAYAYTDATAGGTWSSSNTSIATVDAAGNVMALTAGNFTLTYTVPGTCGNGIKTLDITVGDVPANATVTGASNVCISSAVDLTANIAGGKWTSGDDNIATVDINTGKVTGVSAGTVTITYTQTNSCGSTANTHVITVAAGATAAAIAGNNSICTGTVYSYTNATPGGVWSSSDNTVATVDVNGNVTPVKAGTFTLSYTVSSACGNDTKTLNVTVTATPVDATISGPTSVCTGATISLTADQANGTWTSGNTALATINATTGVVTGVAAGNVVITYTQSNSCGIKANTQTVTINAAPVLSTIGGNTAICTGTDYNYTNTVTGGTWTSSDLAVATVDVNGKVTPVKAGTFTLTYTVSSSCGNVSQTLGITVTATPVDAVIAGPAAVCTGSTITLTADQAGGSWTSGNTAIATVNNTTGVVSGITAGNAVITYTQANSCGTKTNTQTVTVNAAPVLTAINGNASICMGNTYAYTNSTPGGTWTSSDINVATVDGLGNVTPVAAGSFTLTYTVNSTCGNVSTTLAITVGDKPLVSTINGAGSVCAGATISLSNSTPSGTWSSTDNTIATVDVNGTVTGVAGGMVNITYSVSNSCGTSAQTKTITVNTQPVVAAIAGSNNICTGATQTYTNATAGGTWSSSDNSIATVSAAGVVTPLAKGTFILTYTVNSVCGNVSKTLSVNVDAKPVLSATTGTSTLCAGSVATLNNSYPGGTWSSSNTAVASIDATGKVTANAVGTADMYYAATNGCGTTQVPFTVTVSDKPQVPAITGVTDICKNAQTNFSNTLAGGQWSSANNSIATVNATTGAVSGVSAGTTNIIYTVTNTCGSSAQSHAITVNDIPVVPAISGIADICQNTGIQLSNTTANGVWSSSNSAVLTVDASGWATGLTIGTADITYTVDNKGCVASTKATIQVQGLKLTLSTSTETLVAGKPFTVTSTGDAVYTVTDWKPAGMFTNQQAKQQTVTLYDQTPVVITVNGKTTAGCLASASITVAAVPNSADFFVPNAFTPNGDGRNDVFKAYGSGIREITLQVYTQWGEKVFESNDATRGWDGTYKGRQQPVGVYVYALKAVMLDGAVITKKGSVNLIR
ncbi:Ig-like domain-containing protein [Chitinophaga sp. Cy-1792]|uniref:Ig-like domain-containing protein n=1 Tax=Chitinophaga sp. Cy-1792 TaxID=2608339 RepID=UPI001423EEF5|nr:Ig-like domain-containing protein [Chitinophaga sp. Cy-1792]NIG56630.1 T9SS type B sorting domain-containing protein [Chitinophaga sp. Cy-1792]